jgi:CHAD domain-containing protein
MENRARLVEKASDRNAALHDVRKAAKRLRYALEAVEPVFGKPAKKLRKKTKKLQRPLGDRQDMVVLLPELRRLAVSAYAAAENAFTFGRLHAIVEARVGKFEREYLDRKGTK